MTAWPKGMMENMWLSPDQLEDWFKCQVNNMTRDCDANLQESSCKVEAEPRTEVTLK